MRPWVLASLFFGFLACQSPPQDSSSSEPLRLPRGEPTRVTIEVGGVT